MKLDEVILLTFYAIFAYLILSNSGAANTIISSGGGFITNTIGVLQGRTVSGSSFGGGIGTIGGPSANQGLFGGLG